MREERVVYRGTPSDPHMALNLHAQASAIIDLLADATVGRVTGKEVDARVSQIAHDQGHAFDDPDASL
jgi:hypothetical protein